MMNIISVRGCMLYRLGQFSMKCKVVGIFVEKFVNIHFT